MADDNNQSGAQGSAGTGQNNDNTQNTDDNNQQSQDANPSLNTQAKELPWVKEMASELTTLRAERAERQRVEDEAKQKKLEEEGKFKEALQVEKDRASKAEQNALSANIKAALHAKGAKVTDGLVKVAVAEYDSEKHESFDLFADSILKDENYAGFLPTAQEEPGKPKPPVKASTGDNSVPIEQVKTWEKSTNRDDRQKARDFLRTYRLEHGKYPY